MVDTRDVRSVTDSAPTIWSALDGWARTLSSWQQYIIATSISRGRLSDDEIDDAYQRFLRAKGLSPTAEEDEEQFPLATGRPTAPLANKLVLTAIDGLSGINALPEGTAITFGPGLTVIYGRNGAGKSGFVRLIANACFSRQKPSIIGNIYADGDPPTPTAQFHVSIGDTPQDPITFTPQVAASELQRISVFDAAVARHHITQASAFEFKPAGFDVFPELARVYRALAEKLDREIARRTASNEFLQSFLDGGTVVHTAVAGLGPDTDLRPLRELARYGAGESARITDLDKQLSALRAQSPKEILASLTEALDDIRTLRLQIIELGSHFTQAAVTEQRSLITRGKEALAIATAVGSDQFKRPFFKAVGTPEWEEFATRMHALAQKEHEDYPTSGDRCLLCERVLDDASRAHVAALFAFVESDSRKTAAEVQGVAQAHAAVLSKLDVPIFSLSSRVRTHVHKLAPDLEPVIESAQVLLASARDSSITDVTQLTARTTPVELTSVIAQIDLLAERIASDIVRLQADNTETAIASLELERRTIRHRQLLSQLLPAIEAFVVDADWARRARVAKAALGTRPITDKEKELFAQVVGDGYRSMLVAECEKLGCDVPVEMQTIGRSGQTLRTLAMRGGHKPEGILSEGEQKAVALADFFTEVSLNPASAGIVIDDPVTSQDHQRKGNIATRLVKESLQRQVIVFTHDLVFLNQLLVAADVSGCNLKCHWIDRSSDGQPGQIALGDSPVTSWAYENTDRAELALSNAKTSVGTEREDAIRKGMAALRTTLEETVVRRIFKDAVPRWSDQVRVTALRRVNWDNKRVEEVCALYEDLSRFIEAHSHTDEATGAPATVSDLEMRIAKVKELLKWARTDRQKGG